MIRKHYTKRTPRSIRLTDEQEDYFQKIRKFLIQKTGEPISRTWIIKKMMAYGQAEFHREFGISQDALDKIEITKEDHDKLFRRSI